MNKPLTSATRRPAISRRSELNEDVAQSRAELFAIAVAENVSPSISNVFPGTQSITLPQSGQFTPTLQIFAGMIDRVQCAYDADTETAIYLWGPAVHPNLSGESLLLHVANVARNGESHRLREVLGNFVFILDDRWLRRITFITDPLGVRPWFVGSHGSRLVSGSDVLKICQAGLSTGQADYDAISCWLKYNHALTGASVVQDYKNPAAGMVTTYDITGRLINETAYGAFEFGDTPIDVDELADRLVDITSRSLVAATRGIPEVNFPLSGGYDSRLLFALALRSGLHMHAQTMQTREYEVAIAMEVAAALKHPLDVVPGRRRILDMFDDPFAFNAAGFPTGRNLTSMLARRHPGMPLISGYLGDCVMRGALTPAGDRWWAKDRQKLGRDELAQFVHSRYLYLVHRFHLLKKTVAANIDRRALHSMQAVIQRGQTAGKPVLFTDLHARHPTYTSNILLQHLDVVEAIVPYYCWELINCRTSYRQECYTSQTYPGIFHRHFPSLAGIRHTSEFIPSPTNGRVRPPTPASRHLRRFSAELIGTLALTDRLGGMRKKHILSLLPSGLLGEPRFQAEIQFSYKLQLFEHKLHHSGISFDWAAI